MLFVECAAPNFFRKGKRSHPSQLTDWEIVSCVSEGEREERGREGEKGKWNNRVTLDHCFCLLEFKAGLACAIKIAKNLENCGWEKEVMATNRCLSLTSVCSHTS